jgi:hypothetical protein
MTINITPKELKIKIRSHLDQFFLYGDSQLSALERSMSPQFAGILDTKIYLQLDMVLMTS